MLTMPAMRARCLAHAREGTEDSKKSSGVT